MPLPPSGRAVLVATLLTLTVSAPVTLTAQQAPRNTLTQAERAGGWQLLFDGSTTAGWRGFRMDSVPANWQVIDGALTCVGDGVDLLTDQTYAGFELQLEWMIAPKGNSGILYRVTEAEDETYWTGPEYQLLDDAGQPPGLTRITAAGAVYALYPAPEGLVKPAGQWNTTRIVIKDNNVQHWLNGTLAAQYVLGSADFNERVAKSKFSKWPAFGKAATGHIALQSHGGRVAFRNIKIKVTP
ncbi:MAG: DUF1080 domain-containing protein [Gemmatimonadales bacterium]